MISQSSSIPSFSVNAPFKGFVPTTEFSNFLRPLPVLSPRLEMPYFKEDSSSIQKNTGLLLAQRASVKPVTDYGWPKQLYDNCVTVAILGVLYKNHPNFLSNWPKSGKNKEGVFGYTMQFYNPKNNKKAQPIFTAAGEFQQNAGLEPRQSKAAMVEWALQKYFLTSAFGGKGIRNTAWVGEVTAALFGKGYKIFEGYKKEITAAAIINILKENRVAVLGTGIDSKPGISERHAYGILSVNEKNKTIQIYNPKGKIVTIPYDYLSLFYQMAVSPPLKK
jgi:hypothetical protein